MKRLDPYDQIIVNALNGAGGLAVPKEEKILSLREQAASLMETSNVVKVAGNGSSYAFRHSYQQVNYTRAVLSMSKHIDDMGLTNTELIAEFRRKLRDYISIVMNTDGMTLAGLVDTDLLFVRAGSSYYHMYDTPSLKTHVDFPGPTNGVYRVGLSRDYSRHEIDSIKELFKLNQVSPNTELYYRWTSLASVCCVFDECECIDSLYPVPFIMIDGRQCKDVYVAQRIATWEDIFGCSYTELFSKLTEITDKVAECLSRNYSYTVLHPSDYMHYIPLFKKAIDAGFAKNLTKVLYSGDPTTYPTMAVVFCELYMPVTGRKLKSYYLLVDRTGVSLVWFPDTKSVLSEAIVACSGDNNKLKEKLNINFV